VTLDEIAERFDATPTGTGFLARCPAHPDDRASLSLGQGDDDRVLLRCFAGCATPDVLAAVGLTMKDLFVSNGNGHHHRSPVIATYDYCDLTGTLRYRKQRTADKQFRFERPDGHGGWIASAKQNGGVPVLRGVDRLLYRLPDLREASEGSASETFCVVVAEGEKDADRLWSLGVPATTNDAGASQDLQKPKWTAALTRQLTAIGVTSVVCLPVNDDPGRAHMRAVAESCARAGLAVRIVALPDLPPKGDVSDWLDAGHTVPELAALAEAADVYAPPALEEAPPAARPAPTVTHARTLADVHAVFVRYLGADYDLGALDVMLAAAAAEQLDGDPLWLLIISGPGHAKTETVQALSGIGAICVSTVASEGALLSASPKRERAKEATGGLLRQLGARGILVVKDVTSILSMQSNTRAPMLSAFREIHDGKWVRTVGTDGGKTLTWAGRVVVIGACTTAWDTHHSAIATMGDRFVLVRMDSHHGRHAAGRQAIQNTGQEIAMRAELAEACAGLLQTVDPQQARTLTAAQVDTVLAAANITALCRTGVEYDYRGEPIEAHMPEMPTRFAKQLTQVIRGGVAIGLSFDAALTLAVRCARDSMPPIRLAILADLWQHPDSLVTEVRGRLNLPYTTVKRQVESLYLLQMLTCTETPDQQVEKIEIEGEGTPDAPAKTRRTMKARTLKRYRVVADLLAEALGLPAYVPETPPDM
jgi:hypothetical protein